MTKGKSIAEYCNLLQSIANILDFMNEVG